MKYKVGQKFKTIVFPEKYEFEIINVTPSKHYTLRFRTAPGLSSAPEQERGEWWLDTYSVPLSKLHSVLA